MTNEEFLRDVCPNHTDKSKWNKSELLHILELQKEQLRLHIVSQRSELLLKQMSDWLMTSTTLSVEAIVEFQEKFKQ